MRACGASSGLLVWPMELVSPASPGGAAEAAAAEARLGHAPWALEDIVWDPLSCSAAPAAWPAPPGAALLPPPPRAVSDDEMDTSLQPAPAQVGPPAQSGVCCQVPGCGAPLEGRYYQRNRLCATHVRAPVLCLEAIPAARFCQVRPARAPPRLALYRTPSRGADALDLARS